MAIFDKIQYYSMFKCSHTVRVFFKENKQISADLHNVLTAKLRLKQVLVLCTCIASLKLIENHILRLSQQASAPP